MADILDPGFIISKDFVKEANDEVYTNLKKDYENLGERLARGGIDIDGVTKEVAGFNVAIPSWALGTGGTRFGRFPNDSEPRNIFEKLVDASTVHLLTGATPSVSLHIPWDKPEDADALLRYAADLGLSFDAMNSNTFQDQPDQKHSYKFGSLSHTKSEVRRQAIEHNWEVIEIGEKLGSKALTVWIGDGGSFPGQVHFRSSLHRVTDSLGEIYHKLPDDWQLFVEYKPYEPAFYSTVIGDWGTAYIIATQLGPKAKCLVDLGHHLPNTNVEMVVARLIDLGKLGGFHFNDNKYGDDDIASGSIKPYQLFLIFNELIDAALDSEVKDFNPAYMIDQSHNMKDPVEELCQTSDELQRAYAKALLVDREKLSKLQEENDVLYAENIMKAAFNQDVSSIIAMARYRTGAAVDPIEVYRKSAFRAEKDKERKQEKKLHSGIV